MITVVHAENEAGYPNPFRGLKARRLERVDQVIGDDHAGFKPLRD